MTGVLIRVRRGSLATQRADRGEVHVKIEAETEVMQPLPKESVEPSEARRGKERWSSRTFRSSVPGCHLDFIQTFGLQNCE